MTYSFAIFNLIFIFKSDILKKMFTENLYNKSGHIVNSESLSFFSSYLHKILKINQKLK